MSYRLLNRAMKGGFTQPPVHWAVLIGLAITGFYGRSAPGAPGITELTRHVSVDSYTRYLRDDLFAHDGDDRSCSGPEHDLARARIQQRFLGFGLFTSLSPPFICCGQPHHNVIGVHPGAVRPEAIYILGAHYDTVPGSPGAWDNASGVAGVLEAARALSQYTFEATIVFIAFDCEEEGRRGSAAYAHEHRRDDIRGVICLDGIAYRPYPPHNPDYSKVGLYYATHRTQLIDDLAAALRSYAALTCVIARDDPTDDGPFAHLGFATAALVSHGWKADVGPLLHTPRDSVDTPGYLDYHYGAQVTRGAVGYLASQARLMPARVPADFNGDGVVNFRDYALLVQNWGQNIPACDLAPTPGGDGVVNLEDLAAFSQHWLTQGSTGPPALVSN